MKDKKTLDAMDYARDNLPFEIFERIRDALMHKEDDIEVIIFLAEKCEKLDKAYGDLCKKHNDY